MTIVDDVVAEDRKHAIPGLQSIVELAGLEFVEGRGSHLFTRTGESYLDLYNGVGVCNIGHSHPRFVATMSAQVSRLVAGTFYNEARSRYLGNLADVLPAGLDRVQMYSTGSEAVEAALRFVRATTGRHDLVSCQGGFHGKTLGALSLHGGPRRRGWGPLLGSITHIPYAACEGCRARAGASSCTCTSSARGILDASCDGPPAAIVVEPVQGTAGNIVPPREFLVALRGLADELGALLVFDEVITGFGRTGAMTASETFDVVPDVMLLGKAMGSGVPVSALAIGRHLAERDNAFFAPSTGSSTFGGNPLAAAAALVTLEVIKDEELLARGRAAGVLFGEAMSDWCSTVPVVDRIHRAGLMIGLELVDPGTGQPLDGAACTSIFRQLLDRGVLAMAYGPQIRLYPSLAIDDDEVEQAVSTLRQVLVETCGGHS